jgi:hypothetical protein
MAKPKRYLLGFWVLCSIVFLQLLSLSVIYFFTRILTRNYAYPAKFNIFNVYQVILIAILLLEAMIYWSLRNKIVNTQWVKAHVWLIFFGMVIIPFLTAIILAIVPQYFNARHLKFRIINIRVYISWTLFALAHVFFVLTLHSFFKNKNQQSAVDSGDILEEFSD